MTAPTHLMNADFVAAFRTFVASFARRRFMTAPEFSSPRSWHAFRDQYEQDLAGQLHPIHTMWFADMVRRCTTADLDALDALRTEEGASGFQTCMIRCIQQNLLEKAYYVWDGDNRLWPSPHGGEVLTPLSEGGDPVLKRHVHAASKGVPPDVGASSASPAIPSWFRAHGWNLPEDWAPPAALEGSDPFFQAGSPNGEDYVPPTPTPAHEPVSCAAGGGGS